MKFFSPSMLMACLSIVFVSLSGCSSDTKPKSVTEGISLTEIEAYEKAMREMEGEAKADMDATQKPSKR